jgi:hypothetical protein
MLARFVSQAAALAQSQDSLTVLNRSGDSHHLVEDDLPSDLQAEVIYEALEQTSTLNMTATVAVTNAWKPEDMMRPSFTLLETVLCQTRRDQVRILL